MTQILFLKVDDDTNFRFPLPPPCLAQTYSVCTPGSELDSRILNCSGGNNCDYNFVIKTCQMMKPIQIPPPLLSCAPPPVTQPQFHSTSAANSPPFENIKYDFAVFAFLNEKNIIFSPFRKKIPVKA